MALRRIPPRVFSILMSLEPAAAAFAAMIVLGEFLTLIQWLAMACVVIASIGATRTSQAPEEPVAI
jgi:inner membrane transporter RhtA